MQSRLFAVIAALTPAGALTYAQTTRPAATSPLQRAQAFITHSQFDSAVAVLKRLVAVEPANGRAWIALGNAQEGMRRTEDAKASYLRATTNPAAAGAANRALFTMFASLGRSNDALTYFQALRIGGVDLTSLAASRKLGALHDDPRFSVLFPDKIDFSHPFVEQTTIIHEWRGEAAGDEFGWVARGIGDVDHDGVSDVAISAPANPPFGSGAGRVFLYSGRTGALLWKHDGEPGALLGTSLESVGDVNGDGIPDVVVGAPGINAVFVLSGRDGSELYRVSGDSVDVDLGTSVAGVGDIDGDGHPDFAASAPSSGAHGAASGRVYVFSGATGKRIHLLDGENPGDSFGSAVGGANGRLIVGAATAGALHHGRVYVFDKLNSRPTFVEEADGTGVALGYMFVSILGDVDGDGVPDIYAVDFSNTAKGRATGRVYVYSGANGSTIRTFTGDVAGEGFGIGAARTGDVDGDGLADLVVGAWQHPGAAWSGGKVSVLSGRDGHALQTFTGRVPGETLGFDAVGIGDVNGDGVTDYLITSAWSMVNGVRSGRAYIVAGTRAVPTKPPSTASRVQSPSGDPAADSSSVARAAWARASRAMDSSDLPAARRELARAARAWPAQPSYAWAGAVLAARAADTAGALAALGAYARLGIGRDLTADTALARLVALPAFAPLAAQLDSARRPIVRSRAVATRADSTFWPEGVDFDPRTRRYYLASVRHRTLGELQRDGSVRELWSRHRKDMGAMLGIRVDRARGVLWATTSGIPQMDGYLPADSAIAALLEVRISDGTIIKRWDLPPVTGGHVLGDLAIGPHGDVFITDSNQPVLYRLRPAAGAVLEKVQHPLFHSLQGLAPDPSGRWLFLSDYAVGLLKVDLKTNAVTRLADAPNSTSVGCDGIVWYRGSIIAVQNGVRLPRIMRFVVDAAGTKIVRAENIDRNLAIADEPTIGTIADNRFVYVANSQWDKHDDVGKVVAGAHLGAPVLLSVPLPRT